MNRKALLLDMIKETPNDPFVCYALALEYKKEQLPDEARKLLEELKTKHPDYLALYYQLGKILEEGGDVDSALGIYREGLHLATKQRDLKTKSELEEAIWMIED